MEIATAEEELMDERQSKARYTEQVTVMITPSMREDLDTRAIEERVSIAVVARRWMEAGRRETVGADQP